MFEWLVRLITEPPVLWHRQHIKKLVLMTGITPEEQARLNDLVLHMHEYNLERARILAEYYEERGAKFVYILENGKLKRNPDVDVTTDDSEDISQEARWRRGYEATKQKGKL